MLSKFRHCHLVSLIGYYDECNEMILVYEYMPRGTLADHLHKHKRIKNGNTGHLSWMQRIKICIGAARGLDYLHTGISVQHRVIHCDAKSTNILLDENMEARISDFGISKIGPANQGSTYVSTHLKGTFGYMDPYYFSTCRLTRKSDVYSFGVVLFEVLCGRPAVDSSLDEEQIGLAGWAQHCFEEGLLDQIIDPSIKGKILPNSLMAFVKIAIQCLHHLPKKRPSMAETVVSLESALALQESIPYTLVEILITNHNEANVHFSMVDVENANHIQEDKNSSMEKEAKNAADDEHQDEQSPRKSVRMTITKKIGLFLSVTARLFSVHSDAKPPNDSKNNNNRGHSSMSLVHGVVHEISSQIVTPNLRTFTLADLRRATKGFGLEMLLGESGFGRIFKGWVHEDTYAPSKVGVGMAIAVKRFNHNYCLQGHEEWLSDVTFLGEYDHPNLVKMLGYCMEDEERLLVYEYMQKGCLDPHVFKSPQPLGWVVRLKILIGAARCLAFLHTAEKRVIFRDLKSSSILLDGEFNAKLSGFGLAKLGPVNGDPHKPTPIIGTYGYAAPEYVATGHSYVKFNVYGFGVVLLEVLTGMRALSFERAREKRDLVEWAKPFLADKRKAKRLLDASLLHDLPSDATLYVLSSLILDCLNEMPGNRPSMVEVLETLEQLVP